MKKFEYDLLDYKKFGVHSEELMAKMNAMGRSGWELVGMTAQWMVFKREIS